MSRVEDLTRSAIDNVTPQHWQNYINHTRKIEEKYIRKDEAINYLYESFVIPVPNSDSDDDCNE